MATLDEVIAKAPKSVGVTLTLPGEKGDIEIKFTCLYRSRAEFMAWMKSLSERGLSSTGAILESATAWDLDDEMTEEAVERLVNTFYVDFADFLDAYRHGLFRSREKN